MTLAYPMDDLRAARPALTLTEAMDRLGSFATFARNAEIYAQGDDVEHLYRLVSGMVRTRRLTADGRRQVGDFYYPGDLFGLEPGPDYLYAAEALIDCKVQLVRRSAIRAHAGDAALDRAILEAAGHELQRMQGHVMLLGRKNAREKVAAFLAGLADGGDSEVELPMGRQDMADYLGLTIETVSRMLTQLQSASVVEFDGYRNFTVKRWDALENLAA
jgi:CRP/FNR family nitrogen fixation transcriptional regulator